MQQCPTTIVPFFGDQPFWGERVHARGLGPAPIPVEEFSLDKLVDAIRFMLHPKVAQIAIKLTLLHVKLTIVSNSKSGSDLQVVSHYYQYPWKPFLILSNNESDLFWYTHYTNCAGLNLNIDLLWSRWKSMLWNLQRPWKMKMELQVL